MGTFTAQVKAFTDRAKEKLETVVKTSAQEVFSIAQTPKAQGGRMPVDTGFLRNSLIAQLNGATVGGGSDAYVMAVAGSDLGDTIFAGWTANYARHMEYGTSETTGNFYMLGAAQQWQAIVARNADLVRNI